MSGARFRYALEPVLLTRSWELDGLMLELGEVNARLASATLAETEIARRIAAATAAWDEITASGRFQSVDQFVLATRFMGELARQARDVAQQLAELNQERDALIARVVSAKRGVEAAEAHRDEMQAQFVQQRLSGEFKIADDQWNTLQTGALAHGN